MVGRRAIRLAQRMAAGFGLEVRRARPGFSFWDTLPGGAPRTVLDVGANAGQFARRVFSSLPDCIVHSFEPLPGPFTALQQVAADHPQLHCHNFALGERGGAVTIHTGEYTPSSSLLRPAQHLTDSMPRVVPHRDMDISVMRLDDWAAATSLTFPLLVKLDVQGYELQVIRGGMETLRRAAAILTEISFVELYENQPLFADIIEAMSRMGFRLADIYDVSRDPATGLGFQCDGLFLSTRPLEPSVR
jgi:FkbM family methyltransferase